MRTRRHDLRCLTSSLHIVARAWRSVADRALAEIGISEALAFPLVMISRLGNGVTQTMLAASLGMEGPSLVRLLDRLEAAGLAERRETEGDRRAKALHLTTQGEDAAGRIERLLDDRRRRLFAEVSDADLLATLRVLGLIAAAAGAPLPDLEPVAS